MNKENCDKLLKSIMIDDVETFSRLFELSKNLNVCFGRFPVLSLCYMYNAKKIIKKHEKSLFLISKYDKIDEPLSVYLHFRQFAGKGLRLYEGAGSIVTPIEMLAILHCDNKVKKVYKYFCNDTNCVNNLFKIYSLFYNQKIYKAGNEIKIGCQSKTVYQQNKVKCAVAFLSVFMVIVLTLFFMFDVTMGLNVFASQKIFNEKQFNLALSTNYNYVLEKDLSLCFENPVENFNGSIDGNNKTLYVRFSENNKGLILNNNGTIKNLNIVYTDVPKTINISSSACLLCFNNFGTIRNVNLSFLSDEGEVELTVNKSLNDEKFFCAFSVFNFGVVENCKSNLNITAKSAGDDGEVYVSGFVGENSGSIINSSTINSSRFETQDVDVCAIAVKNKSSGLIFGCENHATISQVSKNEKWSPNVAGIACLNYGNIKNCINDAKLSVSSDVVFESKGTRANVIVGGIAAVNYSNIRHCRNVGNIKIECADYTAFVGGIVGYSSYYENTMNLSDVSECISGSDILVRIENVEAEVYVGGFCGFMYGSAVGNVSISTFENGNSAGLKTYIGLAYGLIWYEQTYFGMMQYIDGFKNYVLETENVISQLGAMISIYGTNIQASVETASGNNGQVVITMSSLEGIKDLEEWYEW